MDKLMEPLTLSSAGLLSLPEEVFYRYIFRKLEYSDLLRLRRVCQPIKLFCDDFIRNNCTGHAHVREINETNYTLQHFLQVNLPTSSIFINNSSPAFFEDPLIPEFLRLHGDQITSVRIHHFGTFISEHELHFFSNLPNLQHLDLDFIDASKRDCLSMKKKKNGSEVRKLTSPFPPNFKNLKTLKLNEIQGSQKNDLGYYWDFIGFCDKLDYFKHPLYKGKDPYDPEHPTGQFGCVFNHIKNRKDNHPDQPNLRFYDLEHYNAGNDKHGNRMPWLCILCEMAGVKLLNVNSNLLNTEVMLDPTPKVLVSLRNVRISTFDSGMPNLEKLVVETTAISSFAQTWKGLSGDEDAPMPTWPSLKVLDLKIDSNIMVGGRLERRPEPIARVEDLFDFLFAPEPGKMRETVQELAIRYDLDKVFFKCIGHVPIPRIKDVTDMCPFVTKLTLQGWMGTNKQVVLFWEGLPLLEEVELGECIKLGNVAFVGTEREDPVFLKLKNLRKLTLKRMDIMHKITDLAFDLVFRHLKIKQFYMTSIRPIPWITATGIESLLSGNFNKTVEKFPFEGWSLDGVSEVDFNKLKLKFRATHMI